MKYNIGIFKQLLRYRHALVIIGGLAWIGFWGDSSWWNIMKLNWYKQELEAELSHYEAIDEKATRELEEMNTGNDAVEKVARERFFMKRNDEDIFVFDTDLTKIENPQANETTK